MEVRVLRQSTQKPTAWSGGVTTQLGIWPGGCGYDKRNFGWRVSSARVEAGEARFTDLPGVERQIMTLAGAMELTHDGGESVRLVPFTPHGFDGGALTVSRAPEPVADFNLMTRGGCRGRIQAVGASVKTFLLRSEPGLHFQAFYVLCEELRLSIARQNRANYDITLHKGDFLQVAYELVALTFHFREAIGLEEHGVAAAAATISCKDFVFEACNT